ncbi:cytochrome c oxidase subunit 3 [Sphingomonas sp. ID0503]|uniref:cytochrome c oxidase subunit 3 n=1 Tax=Sphingomonas sp. ID0503 TaxID=3399691 RepID=UPI003AFB0A61
MKDIVGYEEPAGERPSLPGDEGVLFFICADMAMFAVFFLLFMMGQAQDPDTYRTSRASLDPLLGLLNTLVLIGSGWLMVKAVEAGRNGAWANVKFRLIAALVVGLGFAITKAVEYIHKIEAGIGLTTNEFFAYYFTFTGIHFLHFVVGIGVLVVTLRRMDTMQESQRLRWLESAAAYWHMVDLLWLVLFPMLYLAGGTR